MDYITGFFIKFEAIFPHTPFDKSKKGVLFYRYFIMLSYILVMKLKEILRYV